VQVASRFPMQGPPLSLAAFEVHAILGNFAPV
jgi:hypothetical protein